MRKNEFGETISEKELEELARRFRKLSPKQIDEIAYRCGFIITDHENGYKALRKSDVDAILGGFDSAKEKIWCLLAETHINEVKKALAEKENRA